MSADTAPAAMPGVEEIARAIAQADEQNGGPHYEQILAMGEHAREPLFDRARAILYLFAPILAENEAYRQNRHFVMGFNAGFDAAWEQGLGAAAIRAQGK